MGAKKIVRVTRKQRYTKYTKVLIVAVLVLTEAFVWSFPGTGFSHSLSIGTINATDTSSGILENSISGNEQPEKQEADMGKDLTDADFEYLILVNKQHAVAETYKPDDLTDILYFAADRDVAGRYMREEAANAFHRLVEAAAAEAGYELKVTTAYRSYWFQSVLYTQYVEREGQAAADTYSAEPGKSEHQTGLAADVSSPTVDFKLTQEFGTSPEGMWLAENAHQYGFIIRFPKGKEDITGYMYEPWHIRYVGTTAAKEIFDADLTLEEYLEEIDYD